MAKKRKKSKGISLISLVVVLFVIVGAALAFTGLFLDWTQSETKLGITIESSMTLEDWSEMNDNAGVFDGEVKYFALTNTFAWIAAAAVLFILKLVIRLNLLSTLGGIAGIVGLICAILTIIFTVLMGNEYSGGGDTVGNSVMPAVGCYLLLAGGVVGGGAAIAGAIKK